MSPATRPLFLCPRSLRIASIRLSYSNISFIGSAFIASLSDARRRHFTHGASGRVGRVIHLLFLPTRKNLKSLMDVPGKWIDRVRQRRFLDKLILDLNPGVPGVSETCGCRERSR